MNFQPNFSPAAYEAGVISPAAAASAAAWQLVNGNTLSIGLTYLELVISAATLSQVGLIRAATDGTATTSTAGVSVGLNSRSDLSTVNTAWGVGLEPTYAATPLYIREGLLGAAVGNKLIWTWPEDNPLVIPVAGSIVLRNTAGGAMSAGLVSARWLIGIPS